MKRVKCFLVHIKSLVISPVFTLFLVIILLLLSDAITDMEIRSIVRVIVCILFGSYFVLETFRDLAKKQYRTHYIIAVADLIRLITLGVMYYNSFRLFKSADSNAEVMRTLVNQWGFLILFVMIFIREYLTSCKFLIHHSVE